MALQLHFGWSSSAHYPHAIALARGMPGVQEQGEGREREIRVPVDLRVPHFAELLHLVNGWKRTQLRAGDQPLPAVRVWLLQRVIECWQDRAIAGVGRQHCWGAPLLRRGRVPCLLLDERLPPDPQGASRNEWDAYLTAAAHETLVIVCPAYATGPIHGALHDWFAGRASRRPDVDRDTLARLLADVDVGDG